MNRGPARGLETFVARYQCQDRILRSRKWQKRVRSPTTPSIAWPFAARRHFSTVGCSIRPIGSTHIPDLFFANLPIPCERPWEHRFLPKSNGSFGESLYRFRPRVPSRIQRKQCNGVHVVTRLHAGLHIHGREKVHVASLGWVGITN